MTKLYGTSKSRAARSLVALEELGVDYAHVPLIPRPGTADRETLRALNPNLHIPVLEDDGLVLWESIAINLYLGDKHGGALWPSRPVDRAVMYQWGFWVQTEIDRPDWVAARRSGDDERIRVSTEGKIAALGILDAALARRSYLLGDAFSLADVNVAASISQPNEGGKIDWQRLDPFELGLAALGEWLARCTARDSWKRVAELD
jgi:glutathione S-transferase